MQDKKQAKTKKILLLLANHLKVKGIQGVAQSLGENPNKLYAWIKNGNIGDTGSILGKYPEIRKEWLETGEGEMFVSRAGEPLTNYAVSQVHQILSPEDEKLLEILKSMPRAREAMEAFLALPERKQKIHLGKMLESLEELEGEQKK